jgi:hypothetical protein
MDLILNCAPKFIVSGLLLYALYYIIKCPCDVLVNCHFEETVAALSGALATILLLNVSK